MNIMCVDDETIVLNMVTDMCKEIEGVVNVTGFTKAVDALAHITENDVDIAVLDIDMPDMNGLELAARIKEINSRTAVVFLTGYSEYAVDAFGVHAAGYILKPVIKERLISEIQYVISSVKRTDISSHINIKTFGNFDIFVDGKPVSFTRSKAKELLAYLVNKNGSSVSRQEAFAGLYENVLYDRPKQKQFDVIIRSLKTTLDNNGINEIFEMQGGLMRVVPKYFDCDLYRFLDGDINAVNSYCGEYMSEYSWGSYIEGFLSVKYDEFHDK